MLEPIDKILDSLCRQPGWELYRQFCQCLEAWRHTVNPRFLARTRPFSLDRGTLLVATSGAALSQELSLQRNVLLKRLNSSLDIPLADLHFSSARWRDLPDLPPSADPRDGHPCTVDEPIVPEPSLEGFDRFREIIRRRAALWPSCPLCDSPTPKGEIDRWGRCAICAARDF